MTQFDSEVELDVVVDQSSLRDARAEIEAELGDAVAGVDSGTSGTAQLAGGSGGRDVVDHTSDLVGLAETRNDLLRDLLDAQEQGNFDRALGRGGGGALGGALLGLGAIGGLGAGLVSFLQNFEFDPPNIPPIAVPPALDPVDVPVPAPLDPVDVPVPGPLDPVEVPVPGALDPLTIPEPDWLPIDIPAPGETPTPSETPAPSPSPSPTPAPDDDRTTDDTPAPVTNPMAGPSSGDRPSGETGTPDPQNQPAIDPTPDTPAPTDINLDEGTYTTRPTGGGSGVGIEEILGAGAGVGALEAVRRALSGGGGASSSPGSSIGFPAIGSQLAARSDLLPDLPNIGQRDRRAMTMSTPTASNTESISARPTNVTVQNNVTAEGVDERELDRAMEQAKREVKEELRRRLTSSF